jgi:hypothetical protein
MQKGQNIDSLELWFNHICQLSVALVFRVFLTAGAGSKLVMRW